MYMILVILSLWPSDAMWHDISWLTLVEIMACCLVVPSHYVYNVDSCQLDLKKHTFAVVILLVFNWFMWSIYDHFDYILSNNNTYPTDASQSKSFYILPIDDLGTQGAMASADMELINFTLKYSLPNREWFIGLSTIIYTADIMNAWWFHYESPCMSNCQGPGQSGPRTQALLYWVLYCLIPKKLLCFFLYKNVILFCKVPHRCNIWVWFDIIYI